MRLERLSSQEAQLPSPGQSLELRVRSQGLQERANVVAHRSLREVEFLSNIFSASPFGEQSQNLQLPGRERRNILPGGSGSVFLGGELDQTSSHLQRLVRSLRITQEVYQVRPF